MNAFEAQEFIYNHPNAIDENPDHPAVNRNEYAFEFIGVFYPGKPQDDEFKRAIEENAFRESHIGQFINALDWGYFEADDGTINVWLETGPAYWSEGTGEYMSNCQDIKLDCSAPTFEEALIKLAGLIKEYYGDYESGL